MTSVVAEIGCPEFFVESFEHRVRVGDQTPKAPRRHNLGIGQVRGNLPQTPGLFIRRVVNLGWLRIGKRRHYQVSPFAKSFEKIRDVIHMQSVIIGAAHVVPAYLTKQLAFAWNEARSCTGDSTTSVLRMRALPDSGFRPSHSL